MALNKKLASAILFGLSTALAGTASADIDITIGSGMGAVGGTVDISYDYAALDADDAGAFQFDLVYDNTVLSPADITMCTAGAPATHIASACAEPNGAGGGVIRVFALDIVGSTDELPLSITPFGTVTFNVLQSGTHTLTFANGVGSDTAGGNVAIGGTDGSITGAITGAAGFGSTPAPGATIDLGAVELGTTTGAMNIDVSETGDQTLDVTAITFSGANMADFATSAAPFMIADGGANVLVDLTCTPGGRGMRTGTVELTNNSVNSPNAQYTVECAGLSPNVAAPANVTIPGGVIGSANSTMTFDITNMQDGFAFDATNATLTDNGGSAEISITTGLPDGTISIGETNTITLECDHTTSGNFTETFDLTYDDAAAGGGTNTITITASCNVANAFPVFESDPAAGMTIDFGTIANGDTSGPMGVDVGNSGAVGGAALNVTAATITGGDAAQFALTFSPFTIPAGQAPDGTDDLSITCSPNSATNFAATLTINTDDPNEPAGGFTYPLACVGGVDSEFGSNPAPGSTISFGVVPPGVSVDSILNISNGAGANDDLTVDCSLTGDAEISIASPTFPQTIAAGADVDVTLNCAVGAPGSFSSVLSCSTNDPNAGTVTYDLTCIGQPLVVPTLSQWGLLAMALLLMFGGAVAFRLRNN
jgi:hypothetical protein